MTELPLHTYDWFSVMCALLPRALRGKLDRMSAVEARTALVNVAATSLADHPPYETISYRVRIESLSDEQILDVKEAVHAWWELPVIARPALQDWVRGVQENRSV